MPVFEDPSQNRNLPTDPHSTYIPFGPRATYRSAYIMPLTYAITLIAHQRRTLFIHTANADLMLDLLVRHRSQNRYQLHAFAILPDHLHVLLTPSTEHALPRCIQYLKGGYSHAIREQFQGEVWHPGHHEHRVRDKEDFENQKTYIARNPARRHLTDYPYVHTHWPSEIDPMPPHLR